MTSRNVPERNKKRAVADKDDKKKKKNKFAEAFAQRYGDDKSKKAEKGKPIPPKRK